MAFEIDELQLKNDSVEEQIRLRKIFEVLKEKAIKQESLTEHEKEFFCMAVKISHLDDGTWEDYSCCDNYKFKSLYLTYFHDLTGVSLYQKVKGMSFYKVEPNEAQTDLQYLYNKSDEWKLIILKTNHSDQLLQQISTESRKELKNLYKLPEVLIGYLCKGSFVYIFKERAILLHSKYIYCIALEIFKTLKPEDLVLEINSIQIEFNEYSLIHILNRHYAQIMKQYNTGKTFHNEDFKPRILSVQLKEILHDIDNSKLLQGKGIDKIGFHQNGTDYLIWTSEKIKSVKGRGNVSYRRLDTFYPVSDEAEKNKLIATCDLKRISNTLSVYVPK
ncbi:MAG: hypothetical protein IPM47_18970 [Sphingobacteriales bacterium]|nr:MAG: hypothetical protein IPM47_18970 [Sphingobacteriales bacterium]